MVSLPGVFCEMRFLYALILLVLSLEGVAQTPLLRDPDLLELESIIREYSDVASERIEIEVSSGTVVLLEVEYAELPETDLRVIADEGQLFVFGFVPRRFIDPQAFLRSEEARTEEVWEFDIDSDGDLTYAAVFTPETREDMENGFIAMVVLLDMALSPHVVNGLPESGSPTAASNEGFAVSVCVEGLERAWMGMPEEFLREVDAWGYCNCLDERLAEDPSLISAILNPGSAEGKSLIASCWESAIPRWEELGITMDMMFAEFDEEEADEMARKSYVRGCVKAIMDDPQLSLNDYSYGEVEQYCGCLFDQIKVRTDVTMDELLSPDSDVVVELNSECDQLLGGAAGSWNEGKGALGCYGKQVVDLLWDGSGYKMKLNIGGVTRYILLDSGASEVVISRDWFNALRNANVDVDYDGAEFSIMADGSNARVERYTVASVQIGDCVFRDFTIGVMEEGGMLCGMGLLRLFDSWSIDTGDSKLILTNN